MIVRVRKKRMLLLKKRKNKEIKMKKRGEIGRETKGIKEKKENCEKR